MADTKTTTEFSTGSWTFPTPDDDDAWQAMTREEQLQAMRDLANHPDTNTLSTASMDDIRRAAHERCLARRKADNG